MTRKILPAVFTAIFLIFCTLGIIACGGAETDEGFLATRGGLTYRYTDGGDACYVSAAEPGDGTEALTEITVPDEVDGYPVTAIGENAFAGLENLTYVSLPAGLTEIGDSAFYGCSSLISVDIPDSVTKIGDSAFYGCMSLMTVDIPGSVTKIGDSAFYGCTSLTAVDIPGSVTKIGDSAFYGCSSLISVDIPGSVTEIGAYAFYGCTSLISVDIPGSVTEIGAYAFYGCTSLISVDIPGSVTEIGAYAFYGCTSLISVVIPDGVESLGDYAFSGCDAAESLTIGRGLAKMGNGAFADDTALTEIYYNAENLADLEVNNRAFTDAGRYAPDGITLYIGEHVQRIPACLFGQYTGAYSPHISDVVFPENGVCAEIGNYAFSGCSSIVKFSVPDCVETIGSSVFYGCGNLEEIEIGRGIASIGYRDFYGCSSLVSVSVPYVSVIGNSAFYGCSSLVTINILGVTEIGASAFANCTSLGRITFGNGLVSIGDSAFSGCTSLESVTVPDSTRTIGSSAFSGCTSLESLTIGTGTESLGIYAFSGCHALSYIEYNAENCADLRTNNYCFYEAGDAGDGIYLVIGASVAEIPAYLFYPINYDLYHVAKITEIVFVDGGMCTVIGNNAFNGCTYLERVTAGNSVTVIGDHAFARCSSLREYVIRGDAASSAAESVIGDYAFYGCSSLKDITVPEGCVAIGKYAFFECTSLPSVSLPDSVETIGDKAFSKCLLLTAFTVTENVVSIGLNAFLDCNKLVEVYNLSSLTITAGEKDNGMVAYYAKNVYTEEGGSRLESIGGLTFYHDADTDEYYLVDAGVETEEVVLPDYILDGRTYGIYGYCFSGWKTLKKVTIGLGVTSIGYYAFSDCTALEEIYFNAVSCDIELKYEVDAETGYYVIVDNGIFYNCGRYGDGITLVIGKEVTAIPAYMFALTGTTASTNSPRIISVIFVEGSVCGSIGDYAFYGCSYLCDVMIGENVKYIGDSAFGECRRIERVYYCGTEEEWEAVRNATVMDNRGNSYILSADGVYFYSGDAPAEEGLFWHYGTDGKAEIW